MRKIDYENAVSIVRDIYWVGFYDKASHLHCNPYLLIDDSDVILFDSGSVPDFPIVMRKVIDQVNPSDINYTGCSSSGSGCLWKFTGSGRCD